MKERIVVEYGEVNKNISRIGKGSRSSIFSENRVNKNSIVYNNKFKLDLFHPLHNLWRG